MRGSLGTGRSLQKILLPGDQGLIWEAWAVPLRRVECDMPFGVHLKRNEVKIDDDLIKNVQLCD